MRDAYKTETLPHHGKTYRVEWVYDRDAGAPWDNSDCHGIVSDWETRDKLPGELILNQNGRSKRFYDFAASVKKARAEGWNTAPYNWKTKGEQAHAAALADFEYLRRWCNDDWHYCGITVTLLDDEGDDTDISASLWGVEDDGYCSDHVPIIQDLIVECEHEENRNKYPVTHCAV